MIFHKYFFCVFMIILNLLFISVALLLFPMCISATSKDKISLNQFNALNYLTEKQRKKGGNITYVRIEMAEYLLPDSKLSTEQNQELFAIRNMMVDLPDNFSSGNTETLCSCGEREVMSYLLL